MKVKAKANVKVNVKVEVEVNVEVEVDVEVKVDGRSPTTFRWGGSKFAREINGPRIAEGQPQKR